MENYLGTQIITDLTTTDFKDYTKSDWMFYMIEMYGGIDGSHHKDWVLDQCARIAKGTKVIVSKASWENGYFEYRIELDNPSVEYLQWRQELADNDYGYDEGIAP